MTTIALNVNQIAQLFHAHHEAIVAFLAKRVRCSETAQDLSQETYLRLLCKEEISHDANLKAYLFRIAERLALIICGKPGRLKITPLL